MPTYHFTFSGDKSIPADDAADAYLVFWRWLLAQVEAEQVRVIVEEEEACQERSARKTPISRAACC